MLKNIGKFIELFNCSGLKFEVFKNTIWTEYNKMIIPVGPVKFDYSISEEEADYLLQKFPKAILVRYTDGFHDENPCKEWYAVICDKFIELDELSGRKGKQIRNEIKRGLRNCIVQRVDANFIAEHGYKVHASAFERYKGVKGPNVTEEDFKKRIIASKDFEDIVHYWGVFHGNKLIAYEVNYIYDNIEVYGSTVKFSPDFLKLYPSHALEYTMDKYYLKDMCVEYINSGFKNILHQTNSHNFLIEKFNFKKAYTSLNINYTRRFYIYISATYPIRGILRKLHPGLSALYEQEGIRRNCLTIKKNY